MLSLLASSLSAPVGNSTTSQDAVTYDKARSARLVAFSGIAYCTGTLGKGVSNWDCAHCKDFPSVKASTFSAKGESEQNGYVAYDPNDGADGSILVVFTGTDPLKFQQWIDDIDTIAVSYPGCAGCKVHQGFYDNCEMQPSSCVARRVCNARPDSP
uniref:Uncharacterized protein n=1 Tax=Prymnesium polylepis TaxID=72548 RepID=A0A6V3YUF8_9EUKA|mmetsp:Transcript_41040/g.102049  ORF Transcript_41040/g.102049 Transcript_41040/m.102049 type:complete len:156 (+) Transcript_41040:111-578(+)|eukprot:4959000-Prymnesium_polylepis.1